MDGSLSTKGAFSIPHEDHLGGIWLHHRSPTVGEGELFANPQGLPCQAIVHRGKDFAWRDDAYLLLWPSADGQVVNVRIFDPARDRLPGLATIRTPSDAIDLDACPDMLVVYRVNHDRRHSRNRHIRALLRQRHGQLLPRDASILGAKQRRWPGPCKYDVGIHGIDRERPNR